MNVQVLITNHYKRHLRNLLRINEKKKVQGDDYLFTIYWYGTIFRMQLLNAIQTQIFLRLKNSLAYNINIFIPV